MNFYIISISERLLAAQNPLSLTDRPHQLFADAPPPPQQPPAPVPPSSFAPPPPPPVSQAPMMSLANGLTMGKFFDFFFFFFFFFFFNTFSYISIL